MLIAKGSAWESRAHTDSHVDFGLVPQVAIVEVRALQAQNTALLITTIRRLESELRARNADTAWRGGPDQNRISRSKFEFEIET